MRCRAAFDIEACCAVVSQIHSVGSCITTRLQAAGKEAETANYVDLLVEIGALASGYPASGYITPHEAESSVLTQLQTGQTYLSPHGPTSELQLQIWVEQVFCAAEIRFRHLSCGMAAVDWCTFQLASVPGGWIARQVSYCPGIRSSDSCYKRRVPLFRPKG